MLIEKTNGIIYSQCRIPGIVITENSTLLAYYECRRTNSDWADIDIKIIRSTDRGQSWQTVDVIESNGNTLNNPVMIVKGCEIHLLFLQNYRRLFHRKSTDDGISFSPPVDISGVFDECGFFFNAAAVGPGHGIVHDGKMIVPVWFAQNKTDNKAHSPSIISTIYSDDGETWKLGEIIGKDTLVNPSECALAVTGDNRILISIRNENVCHQRAFAESRNGFSNWENLHFNPLISDPVCMGSMCYENGVIYHINCDSATARENLTIKVSKDKFASFARVFVDTPAGYSDIAVKNGELYILYERDCATGGLHFKRLQV